jgi:hypothetical protein
LALRADLVRLYPPRDAAERAAIAEQVYAVSAYILSLNGLLAADATLDAKTLSGIKMPSRFMFVGDLRPDVKNPGCMTGC